jgi:hypothetical protein
MKQLSFTSIPGTHFDFFVARGIFSSYYYLSIATVIFNVFLLHAVGFSNLKSQGENSTTQHLPQRFAFSIGIFLSAENSTFCVFKL